MTRINLPLLAGTDRPVFPTDGNCPECGKSLITSGGVASLTGGALLVDDATGDSVDTSKLEAFFAIGFHGNDVQVRDSVNAQVVDDLQSGQFAVCFCSLACLRLWFNQVVDQLQDDLDRNRP